MSEHTFSSALDVFYVDHHALEALFPPPGNESVLTVDGRKYLISNVERVGPDTYTMDGREIDD